MVALMQTQETQYESGQDLMDNNAADGSQREELLDLFQERGEQTSAIEAVLNSQAAQANIMQAQSAQAKKYIINPISGEVIETEGSEGEVSVAAIAGLLERGASDTEIEAALGEALTTIAGKIAADKKNAKKYMAEMLELLHVLEVSMKQSGKDVDLQQSLRQMQQQVSKLMKDGNIKQIQEFLKSNQLREVLTKSVQQSRSQVGMMKNLQQSMREIASKAQNANLGRDAALRNMQAVTLNVVNLQLRQGYEAMRDSFKEIGQKTKVEVDPSTRNLNTQVMASLREQAARMRLATDSAREASRLGQASARLSIDSARQQIISTNAVMQQLAANNALKAVDSIVSNLSSKLAANVQAIDSRLAAENIMKGNTNVAQQAGKQDVLANLKATESLIARAGKENEGTKIGEELTRGQELRVNEQVDRASKQEANPRETLVQQKALLQAAKIESAKIAVDLRDHKISGNESGDREGVSAEPNDPCAGCGGGKGCCSSVGQTEARPIPAVEQAQKEATVAAVNAGTKGAEAVASQQFTNDQRADIASQAAVAATAAPQAAPSAAEMNDFMSAASPPSETTVTSAEAASQSAEVDSAPSL